MSHGDTGVPLASHSLTRQEKLSSKRSIPLDRQAMCVYRQRSLRIVLIAFLLLLSLALLLKWRSSDFQTWISAPSHDLVRGPSNFGNSNTTDAGTSSEAESSSSTLGNAADPQSRFHIVIAHYDEEPFYIARLLASLRAIPSIAALGVYTVLYTKSPNKDLHSIIEVSTADRVIQLPNVGREGGTYLRHILTNWDSLPPYLLFTQAILRKSQIEGSSETAGMLQEWLVRHLETQFHPSPVNGTVTGFQSLNRIHDICSCGHCTDIGGRDEFYPLWPQLFAMISGRVCGAREPSVLSFNGHFIVSKSRIRARPKQMYEYLQSLVNAPSGHRLHEEAEPRWFDRRIGKSTAQNPKFGHTLERLWHVIFDCADTQQVRDCDISGKKSQGEGGCSCVDRVKT